MPPGSCVTRAALICHGDSDGRGGCHSAALCSFLVRCAAVNGVAAAGDTSPARVAHPHELSDWLLESAAPVITSLERLLKVGCFLHNFWSRSPCLLATCLHETSEQHKSFLDIRLVPCRQCIDSTVPNWQSCQIIFLSTPFPSHCFPNSCTSSAYFHLCNSRPPASCSVLVSATPSKPRVLLPARAQGFCWETVNEWGPMSSVQGTPSLE